MDLSSRMQGINPFHVMGLLRRSRELEQKGREIIHMEIGEPDFPTPPQIVSAGVKALRRGDIKYTVAAGLLELRQAIADHYRLYNNLTIPVDRIFITPGGSGALLLAFAALVERNSQVLMSDPCYPCNQNMVRLFDGEPRLICVGSDSNYHLDLQAVNDFWSENTRGVLIASPSNPTGTLIDPEVLKSIINYVNKRNGFVISDEIYHGLHYRSRAVSALEFSNDAFVVNSFSKYFGMTGWRVGWLVVPDKFIDSIERLAQNLFISAPSPSQFAALAAFDEKTIQELECRRESFRNRRDFVLDRLNGIGFEVSVKPEGAFYIYANCSNFTKNSFEFSNRLIEDFGVAVTPGKDFGFNQPDSYIRLAYTTSMDNLVIGMERIGNAVLGI